MQTLFSEHWHLVKHVKPKLREAVDVFPRRLRGRSWIFLHDQATQKFLRLTPEAWMIIKLMNGRKDLEAIWEESCLEQQQLQQNQRFYNDSSEVISQNDLVGLLGQLYSNDMLQTQMSADSTEIVKRYRKQKFQAFKQSFLNPISIKIPLWYPDQWFSRQTATALRIYTWTFFVCWLAVIVPAMFLVTSHWEALTANLSDRILSTSNLFILWCTYPIVKAVHEWAHGMAVKAWGGVVREIGLMLIIFMPVPYVDATYSYRFTSKWVRALVAATGVMAELFLGALALFVWLNVESGLVRAFAFNVIFIAGVSSLLVNGNPLMRYDGYYVLTDLIEIPNLSQRAKNYWIYLSDRYMFGAKDAKPPMGYDKERLWLFVYGFIAPIYRVFIIFTLIWFVAQKYFFVGILMAAVSAWMSFGLPIYKGVKHIYKGNSLIKKRVQAKQRFYLFLILIIFLLTVVPFPFYSVQQGIAWLPESNIIRANTNGMIESADVSASSHINKLERIVLLSNRELKQQFENVQQEMLALTLKMRQAQSTDIQSFYALKSKYDALGKQELILKQEVNALEVLSPSKGVWYPKSIDKMIGTYVKKGDILGYVAPKQTQTIRMVVEQDVMNLVQERLKNIEIKSTTDLGKSYDAIIVRRTPKAAFELPSAALGINAGGNIIVDPSDTSGKKSVDRVFDLELLVNQDQLLKQEQPLGFNDRVYVRFDMGYMPLGWQWMIKCRQLFLKKFNV